MGAIDLLKSERGLVVLLYLGGLLALMLTGSPHVDRWGQYAGAIVAVYTAAKSLKPNDTAPPKAGVVISREETAEPGADVLP